MSVQEFNQTHIEGFANPRPISKVRRVLEEWMGSGNKAVDVGCGSGFYTDLCRNIGNQIVGIDITSQVYAARERSLNVCQGNVEVLPFPKEIFSLALSIEVVEHLLQPELMIKEICRVLKPGGTLIITTPNYGYWALRLLYLFGCPPVGLETRFYSGWLQRRAGPFTPPWRDPHIRLFTPSILRRFLDENGFEIEFVRSSFVAFPSGLAPYLPFVIGLPLRVIGKLIGNLNFLGDIYPSLLAAGLLVKAIKR